MQRVNTRRRHFTHVRLRTYVCSYVKKKAWKGRKVGGVKGTVSETDIIGRRSQPLVKWYDKNALYPICLPLCSLDDRKSN
jgi:hypothetical protein